MGNPPAVRKAQVTGVWQFALLHVRTLLPLNYQALQINGSGPVIIQGKDNAGWTLDQILGHLTANGITAVEV